MAEYIGKELVLAFCEDEREAGGSDIRTIINRVRYAKPADVAPVAHGRWVFEFNLAGSNFYRCSVCDRQETLLEKEDISEYCPYCHCGARMDGEE